MDFTATNGFKTISGDVGRPYDYSAGLAAYFSYISAFSGYIRNSYASGIQYTGG
jgi:hypothetical protein